MKLKRFCKGKKGVIISDALISILIIILFSGIIFGILTNTIKQTRIMRLKSQQMHFLIDVLEYAEKIPYNDLSTATLVSYVNNNTNNSYLEANNPSSTKPFRMEITVEKYNATHTVVPITFSPVYPDTCKIVSVSITSTLNNKDYVVSTSDPGYAVYKVMRADSSSETPWEDL